MPLDRHLVQRHNRASARSDQLLTGSYNNVLMCRSLFTLSGKDALIDHR
jgi:hypothetical protein